MKRHALLVSVTTLFAMLLAACAGQSSTLEDGVLTVGLECSYAPFNWTTTEETSTTVAIDEQDGFYCDGYDVKVASFLADELSVDVQIRKIAWDGLIPALTSGNIDAIIAGMTDTSARRESISFTDPYFSTRSVMVVLNASEYADATTMAEFEGANVVAQQGTIQDDLLADYAEDTGEEGDLFAGIVHGTAYADYYQAFTALVAEEAGVDAVLAEEPFALQMQAAYPDQLTIIPLEDGQGNADENFVVTVSVGLRLTDTALVTEMNGILASLDQETRLAWMAEATEASASL